VGGEKFRAGAGESPEVGRRIFLPIVSGRSNHERSKPIIELAWAFGDDLRLSTTGQSRLGRDAFILW
jgi:hypothetical protein